jgi:hypothetical protein
VQIEKTVDGMVWFTDLTPGTYTVREDLDVLDGFALTTLPNTRTFTIISGEELVYEDGAAMLPDGDQRFETNVGNDLRWGNTPTDEPAKIKGKVFVDKHKDGYFNKYKDKELKGVKIILSQQDTGQVVAETFTDEWGRYHFEGLIPGVAYKITQIQPHEFKDGPNIPGWSINKAEVGVVEFQKDVVDDMFTNIVLESGECTKGFDFTEHYFSKRDYTSRHSGNLHSVWNSFNSAWNAFRSHKHSKTDGHVGSDGHFSKKFDSHDFIKRRFTSRHTKDRIGSHDTDNHKFTSRHTKDRFGLHDFRKRKFKSRSSSYSYSSVSNGNTSVTAYGQSSKYGDATSAWSRCEASVADAVWTAYGSSWSSSGYGSRSSIWSRFSRW